MNKINKNNFSGFTLLELLVGIAILVLLTAVILPNFSSFKNSQVASSAKEEVLSSLSRARSETLSSVGSSEYGVHFDSNQIVIFKGTTYSAIDSSNEVIRLVSPAVISNISFSGGGNDVYFNKLSGAPSKTGSVLVSVPNSVFQSTITISASGVVSSN